MLDALLRLRDVRDIGVGQITVDVPPGRERALEAWEPAHARPSLPSTPAPLHEHAGLISDTPMRRAV